MRLASLAAIALVSSIALSGCGSDDSASDKKDDRATTTTTEAERTTTTEAGATSDDRDALIAFFTGDDSPIDESSGDCIADESLADLSPEGLALIKEANGFDISIFSDADRGLLTAALDTCVEFDAAVSSIATSITAGLPLTDEEATCAAAGLAGQYEGAGQFIEAVTGMTEEEAGGQVFTALASCVSDETAVAIMASAFTGQGTMDEATSQCIAEQIVGTLGAQKMLEEFAAVGQGDPAPDFEAASSAAATACAGGTTPTI